MPWAFLWNSSEAQAHKGVLQLNTNSEKYKAIACELVEQLSKHGLAVAECKKVLNIVSAAYTRAVDSSVINPAAIQEQIKHPNFGN